MLVSNRPVLTKLISLLVTIAAESLALFSWQQSIQLELFRSSASTVTVPNPATASQQYVRAHLTDTVTVQSSAERASLLCRHQRMVPSVFMIGGTKTGSTAFFHGVSEVRPLTVSTVPLIAVCPLVGCHTVTLCDSLWHHTID